MSLSVSQLKPAIVVAALVLSGAVLSGFAGRPAQTPLPASPSATPRAETGLTLTLDFGNGTRRIYFADFTASASAFSLLQQTAARENFEFAFTQYPFGDLVNNIGGYANSPAQAWIYQVNGQSPAVGAGAYLLRPGDRVEWRYTQPL